MKNPILALLAVLAVITSGLLYAAPTLRDRMRQANVEPQIRVQTPQVQVQPPASQSEPQVETPQIQPPPIAQPKKHHLLPLRKKPQAQQPQAGAGQLPGSDFMVPTTYGVTKSVHHGPNIFHPFSCVTRTWTSYPVVKFTTCPYRCCEVNCLRYY